MEPEWLKFERKALGVSQWALAKKSKVSRFKICQFECGYGGLSEQEFLAVVNVLEAERKKQQEAGGVL